MMTMLDDETRKVLHGFRDTLAEIKTDTMLTNMENKATLGLIQKDVSHLTEKMTEMVPKAEFTPVRNVVYGMTGAILSGAIGAFLMLIFKH